MSFYKKTTEKLKELKTWAQVKSPKPLQPALSYALDWLAPELLGTGFRMMEISDFALKATVPARPTNFDFQQEIHQGLVLNAALELGRAFLQKQMSESYFQLVASDVQISKKQKWTQDIELLLEIDQSVLDDFFIDFQKVKRGEIEFQIKVKVDKSRKIDSLTLKLQVEKTELLA
ncbi:hypothetical protein [Pseudobdellovibrio exovorus]|uniref:Uncharacterized protein n=1 Tax=Pseudobdellovibrio exovorus JSS TaxID=1184267 RepID=M4VEP6_9BACT|nr:hypothetical protein [Pseudobdellovibrio exovorus]AGH96491.1 hypothetical protein A11Q_2275 [Pseudobdellovibrio exovorus JSS]